MVIKPTSRFPTYHLKKRGYASVSEKIERQGTALGYSINLNYIY